MPEVFTGWIKNAGVHCLITSAAASAIAEAPGVGQTMSAPECGAN